MTPTDYLAGGGIAASVLAIACWFILRLLYVLKINGGKRRNTQVMTTKKCEQGLVLETRVDNVEKDTEKQWTEIGKMQTDVTNIRVSVAKIEGMSIKIGRKLGVEQEEE